VHIAQASHRPGRRSDAMRPARRRADGCGLV